MGRSIKISPKVYKLLAQLQRELTKPPPARPPTVSAVLLYLVDAYRQRGAA